MAKKMEVEVKVLDVNPNQLIPNIEKNGGILKKDCIQKIYTYDLGSISNRFDDIKGQLTNNNFEVIKAKLKLVLFEIDNLLTKEMKTSLDAKFGVSYLNLILNNINDVTSLVNFLNDELITSIAHSFGINPNKWVRLRQTGNVTTIAIKNILEKNDDSKIQPVLETEIVVPSIEQANEFLEQLGYAFRNYQEKRRISYMINDIEIDIDYWPHISPYVEIEDTEENINYIVNLLKLNDKEIVSCNTAEVYSKYNMNIYDYRELRFDEECKCK